MCIICVEVQKGKMTGFEAGRAMLETQVPEEHEDQLAAVIYEQGDEFLEQVSQGYLEEALRRKLKEKTTNFTDEVGNGN